MIRRNLNALAIAAYGQAAHTISRTALLSFGVVSFGTVLTLAPLAQAQTLDRTQDVFASIRLAAIDAVPLPRPMGQRLANGTYLFGEAEERDQANQAYMVFDVVGDQVKGAVYWPQSSFNCFEGRFHRNQLALRVRETYSKAVYTHSLALAPDTSLLASSSLRSAPIQMGLEGMHRLDGLNENDQRILAACKAQL